MQGRPVFASSALRVASALLALSSTAPTRGDEFEAFTWARHHPAPTEHVSPLIQIDPWANTNLEEVSSRLKALPPGKRFVIFQGITDDLADNPGDRVIERSWRLQTRLVPAVPSAIMRTKSSAQSSVRLGSSGRAPASATARSSTPVSATSPAIAVTERVPVDLPTRFRGPWMESGIRTVRARVQGIVGRLKALDTPIDGFAVANETTLHAACFLGSEGSLAAIQSDPRWPALASSMGLPLAVSDMWWGSTKYFLWTERMSGRFDAAMNEAVYAPIKAVYPDAVVSNYCSGRLEARFASPDINGHLDRRQTAGFGSHDNFEFYGWIADGRVSRASGREAADLPWLAFRVEMHKIRGMNASSGRAKHAWIAQRSWRGESWGEVPIAAGPLWDELVLQLGMHGVRQFFELSIEDFNISTEANLARRASDRRQLNALLAALNQRVAGSTSGVMVASQPSWDDIVIATGRRVGDGVVWRFSFAPGVEAVKVRFSDGSDAVVTAEEGRCGAWLEHRGDVQLVMDSSGRVPLVEVVRSRADGRAMPVLSAAN